MMDAALIGSITGFKTCMLGILLMIHPCTP